MSAAAAEPADHDGDAPAAPAKGRKKLIVVAAALAVVLAAAGGGAALFIKKKHAAAEAAAAAADGEATPAAQAAAHKETRKTPPAFLPLEAFVVNLADRDTERFAQIGITLELDDAKVSDQLKAYMPAIRNGILMVLAHKTSQELLTRPGKEKLANEIMREAVRPLGIELEGDEESKDEGKKTPLEESPVRHVHFSSFIIQ
ncbi:MAG TPA: flagellar basal body-associated FliL family protein [Albitalea sp.]|uniref:flagellar basal body-associated FliL family protein n=1 Tax=Piscinibacter sp. TaxID=1903157 RepID=UPI002ED4DDC1